MNYKITLVCTKLFDSSNFGNRCLDLVQCVCKCRIFKQIGARRLLHPKLTSNLNQVALLFAYLKFVKFEWNHQLRNMRSSAARIETAAQTAQQ